MIDMLPPSINQAVRHGRNGSYKSKELKEWVEIVSYIPLKVIASSEWYGVEVNFYLPLYYKNGKIKRKDADDMLKYAIDTTLIRLVDGKGDSIDDSRILSGSFKKWDASREACAISFYTV